MDFDELFVYTMSFEIESEKFEFSIALGWTCQLHNLHQEL